ncbi:MAG: serine hydrolase [Propionibacteriaceae bacterium]|nr:serine hydrolase [Propionibacteriaceae bacterium]
MGNLHFRDVSVRFGTGKKSMVAVDHVNLHVRHNQIMGIVGESGSGKSTLARTAVGLVPLHRGTITLGSQPVPLTGPRRPIQMVFQDHTASLNPRMKVGTAISEMLRYLVPRAQRAAEVNRLLELVHLDSSYALAYPGQLSGGQRQRVGLARALAPRPEVIIADEITSNLDVSIQGAILNLVKDLVKELDLTMVFISHNLAVVRYMADDVAVMKSGRIVEQGSTSDVLTHPQHPYTQQLLAAVPGDGGKKEIMKKIDASHWQSRLDTLAKEAGVVGAVLGILRVGDNSDDEMVRVATGLLNVNTGRDTTVDSLFQIGSITKTWTATVIMQLIDEGLISLDQLVKDILPGFTLISPELTNQLTVRHLLNHTGGLDGDVFVDTGRGDDNLEKYMGVLESAVQIHPLGATWSYCNSGYSILGRIIEVVTEKVWDEAMKERLFVPLELTHTNTLPEEALLFDTAVGHVVGLPEPQVTPAWILQRNAGPAGLINASIADLLTFGRLHTCGGVAKNGTRVLSEESAAAMVEFSADVPEKYLLGDSWGLGFERFRWDDSWVFGHDGNTLGQAAFLRFSPWHNLVVGLVTNDSSAHDLYQRLFAEIFEELCGVTIQSTLELPDTPADLDLSEWVGVYERASARIEISMEDDQPTFCATQKGELAELEDNPVIKHTMIPIREGLYGFYFDDLKTNVPVWFYSLPTGERYIHFGARATKKIS